MAGLLAHRPAAQRSFVIDVPGFSRVSSAPCRVAHGGDRSGGQRAPREGSIASLITNNTVPGNATGVAQREARCGDGGHHVPDQTGVRFCRKASIPSSASRAIMLRVMTSAA